MVSTDRVRKAIRKPLSSEPARTLSMHGCKRNAGRLHERAFSGPYRCWNQEDRDEKAESIEEKESRIFYVNMLGWQRENRGEDCARGDDKYACEHRLDLRAILIPQAVELVGADDLPAEIRIKRPHRPAIRWKGAPSVCRQYPQRWRRGPETQWRYYLAAFSSYPL